MLSSRSLALSSKVDWFQSPLSERFYRATALNAGALNVLSLLTAYQAELYGDFAQTRRTGVFAGIAVITHLCFHIQAMRKVMGMLVLQEHVLWLNLATFLDDILHKLIVPDGIFFLKRKRTKYSSFVFFGRPQLTQRQHLTRFSCLRLSS